MTNEIQELKFQVGESWKGVYSSNTAYGLANVVQDATGMSIYRSLKSGNVGHPVTDSAWWFCIIDMSSIKDESDRITALNQAIAQDEALRVAAEELRQQYEATRIAAETQRNEAEQARISAEQTRVTKESQRETNEQQRITDEQGRESAEITRVTAEQARVLAETLRANAEDARATAEQNRVAAEQQRIDNEQTRETQYAADHTRAETDHETAVQDNAQITELVGRADADHVQSAADHAAAESDHATATSDHTTAVSDHTTAAADHTQAVSDHTTAAADHTTAESDHAAVEVYVDSLGAFDLSKYNAVGGVLATYADLSAALTALNALDSKYKYGGMSFKFVQTSDRNYVQFRYMGTAVTGNPNPFLDTANWQGIDDAVIKDSKNPVTGGSIYNALMNIVVINATANKGNVSEDAVITVKVEGETVATETGSVSLVIEYGKEFSVECSRIYDYITPEPQTFTAGPSIQKISCNYTYIERDTITLDQTETDEESMITGDVQGDVIKAIRAASHLYLGTPLQDGSELTCQLSDIDGTKYFDGTNAALDGTEGDQWMKLPVFWWKRTAIGTAAEDGSHDSYSFSFAIAGEPDPSWHKWEGAKNLLGAKEMTVINGVGHSINGGQSTGSLTKAQFEAAAAARGDGNTAVTWEWQWMMCTLFYAWYGRTNSQAQCGTGSNTYERTLGTKDSLGMADTTASNGNSDNTKFWGIENWWGCKSELMGRITSNNYVLTILDMNTGQSRQVSGFVQCAGTAGYISRMKITEDLDFIPVAKSGTGTTSYCDSTNSNTGSRVVSRSNYYANAYGGVAFVSTNNTASNTNSHIGSRLAFNGVVTEAESVAAYKAALPAGQ